MKTRFVVVGHNANLGRTLVFGPFTTETSAKRARDLLEHKHPHAQLFVMETSAVDLVELREHKAKAKKALAKAKQ